MNTTSEKKARALGINHVVLEVGDLDKALDSIARFLTGGRLLCAAESSRPMLSSDIGDQYIQLSLGKAQGPDGKRHFGFVVDDREPITSPGKTFASRALTGPRLQFPRTPGESDRSSFLCSSDIQFTKASHVLKGMSTAA